MRRYVGGIGCGAPTMRAAIGAPGGAAPYVTGGARLKRSPRVTGNGRGAQWGLTSSAKGGLAPPPWRLPALHSLFGGRGKREAGVPKPQLHGR